MDTAALLALSPLDGRYKEKIEPLRHIFSEFGLIKYRVIVEVKWLKMLTDAKLPELPQMSKEASKILDNILQDFLSKMLWRLSKSKRVLIMMSKQWNILLSNAYKIIKN